MKRKSTALLLSLLLLLALCVPALAAIEYGVFYDETEQLGSVELSYAAEQTLPRLTQELGVDLRVDAFTDEDVDADTSAADIAAYVYENSGYGCGEWKEGVSLTLLLRGTENGAYTLSETDWCVYAFLDEARGSAQELSDAVYNAVKPYMVERAWNGEDMTMSATALSQAVNAMAESVEDYIRENASPDVTGGADAPDGLHVHFKHLANAARDQAGDDHDDRDHRPRTFPHGLACLGKAQILVAGGQVLGSTDVPVAVAELA